MQNADPCKKVSMKTKSTLKTKRNEQETSCSLVLYIVNELILILEKKLGIMMKILKTRA